MNTNRIIAILKQEYFVTLRSMEVIVDVFFFPLVNCFSPCGRKQFTKKITYHAAADELDRIVHEATVERDAYPSPLNYYNFPKSLCTSVNEVICHGIPDMR